MFHLFRLMGQYTLQFLSSIGIYEVWQKYIDSPESPDESSIEKERRFTWTKFGIALTLLSILTYKALRKKKKR